MENVPKVKTHYVLFAQSKKLYTFPFLVHKILLSGKTIQILGQSKKFQLLIYEVMSLVNYLPLKNISNPNEMLLL